MHLIHIISKEDEIQININHSTLRGVRLKLDNSNISLHIQHSRFIDAGISIETEENRRHLPVKIANSHFSGQFPEDTLLFNNTKNVTIESCHFDDLKFNNDQSFIIKAVDSVLHIKNSEFRNNTSSVKVQRSTMNISMSLFEGNTGGCIHGNKASLHIEQSNFTRNTAKRGAAIRALESQVTLDRCLLIQNTATGKGRLYQRVGSGWEWVETLSSADGGGAIYITNSSSLTIKETDITQNTGNIGGAVFAYNTQVTLERCSLIQNTATGDESFEGGGAVFIRDGSSLNMTDTKITGNTAGRHGAVFAWINCQVSLERCSLINNSARGGAVYISDGSSLNMTDTKITGNTAGGLGGAVYAFINCQVSLERCSLINNSAQDWGGAVYILCDSTLHVLNCNLSENSAGIGGGALAVEIGSRVILKGNIIASNSAVRGGALAVWDRSRVILKGGIIASNSASRDGGALFIGKAPWDKIGNNNINITSVMFTNNTSIRDGGTIFIEDSRLAIEDSEFTDSSAGRDGGAIKAQSKSTVTIASSQFSNNTSGLGGGAVMVLDHSRLSDTDSNFIQNIALGFGEYF